MENTNILTVLVRCNQQYANHQIYTEHTDDTASIDYIKELEMCYANLRRNAGELTNANIYCISPVNEGELDDRITAIFKKYDIIYLELSDIPRCECIWEYVVHCGVWLEKKLPPNSIIIHIDLDMYCISPIHIPTDINDVLGYVAVYPNKPRVSDHFTRYDEAHVTCYCISNSTNKFYKRWLDTLDELKLQYTDYDQKTRFELEEYAIDVLKFESGESIKTISNSMLGEAYHDNEDMSSTEVVGGVTFIHAHAFQNPMQYYISYVMRCREFGITPGVFDLCK